MSKCEHKPRFGCPGGYDKTQHAGFESLANAIVEQAASDYRDALRTLREPEPDAQCGAAVARRNLAKHAKVEIEAFFRSRWFGALKGVPWGYLIRRLRAESLKADVLGGTND